MPSTANVHCPIMHTLLSRASAGTLSRLSKGCRLPLCFSQAQMVGPLSAAGTMCERMHAVHRWCVTGKAVLLPRPLCPVALLPARQLVALQLMAAFSSANLPCRALPALRHTDGRAPERACRPARPAAHPAAPALWRWVLSVWWCSASVPCLAGRSLCRRLYLADPPARG